MTKTLEPTRLDLASVAAARENSAIYENGPNKITFDMKSTSAATVSSIGSAEIM